jgi:hypothetical protein
MRLRGKLFGWGSGGDAERRKSRHRMQRASRIFGGNLTTMDRLRGLHDKGWWALVGLGVLLIGFGGGLFAAWLMAR